MHISKVQFFFHFSEMFLEKTPWKSFTLCELRSHPWCPLHTRQRKIIRIVKPCFQTFWSKVYFYFNKNHKTHHQLQTQKNKKTRKFELIIHRFSYQSLLIKNNITKKRVFLGFIISIPAQCETRPCFDELILCQYLFF